jgi:multiple sugar transport system ATP-binding protein
MATPEDGDEVIFGVRPEGVTSPDEIESGNLFEMELVAEAVETNGFDKHVAFTYGNSELIGRFAARTEPVIGQPMGIGLDLSNISLFDRRSERRL